MTELYNFVWCLMDKYDKLRKLSRNLAIKKMAEENPAMTYDEIGHRFNITKQRVGAILKAMERREKKEAAAMATAA